MAYDINAIRITGTVERFDIVSTKTGSVQHPVFDR